MAQKKWLYIHPDTQRSLIKYVNACVESQQKLLDLRSHFEEADRLYSREKDKESNQATRAAMNKAGAASTLQDLQVPVVKPKVDTATDHQAAVFLRNHPIFPVAPSDADKLDASLQMEELIDNQAKKGRWKAELVSAIRDGFKYNLFAVEAVWSRHKAVRISTQAGTDKFAQEDIIWEGNSVKKLDLYNSFWDTRVNPSEVHISGEFAGYIKSMSKVVFKQYLESKDKAINKIAAFNSSSSNKFYVPSIVSDLAVDKAYSGFDWDSWSGIAEKERGSLIRYKNNYEVAVVYARIIPSEHKLSVPKENTPQIWKLEVVNDSVLISAELQTNAHDYLPIIFGQPHEDGLGYQSKSLAADMAPMQYVNTSLLKGVLAARRRAVYDRTLYDPTRIDSRKINSANPSPNIPVKPAGYGTKLSEAVYQFPYNDNTSTASLQDIGVISSFADEVAGQNKAQQGQFVKGNKTRTEYSNVMNNATNKPETISLVLEDQFFTPLKEVIKYNILQFQTGESIYSAQEKKEIVVNPVQLRNASLEFKVTDGLLPKDRVMSFDVFNTALTALTQNPNLAAPYNQGAMLSFLFKSQGADISQFEKPVEQQHYEQAVATWQQTVMQAAETGADVSTLPMPKPEDYGWQQGTTKVKKAEKPKQTILEQTMQGDKNE